MSNESKQQASDQVIDGELEYAPETVEGLEQQEISSASPVGGGQEMTPSAESRAPAPMGGRAPTTPMEILSAAVARGTSPEELTKLMDLQDRWEANQARKAYVAAMAKFKADPPTFQKDQHVRYQNKDNTWTEYWHASLSTMAHRIAQGMAPHGLSFTWETNQENGVITVSCVISHKLGHSERTTLITNPDNSGGKNSIQAIGSAVKYLQRYTLEAATGIVAEDRGLDDDGLAAGEMDQKPVITEEQATELHAMVSDAIGDDIKTANWMKKLAKNMGFSMYTDIPADQFENAKEILRDALKQKGYL